MADKEDTWSWWDALKAGGTAVALGAGGAMVHGQLRTNKYNAINRVRGPAQPALKKISEARGKAVDGTRELAKLEGAVSSTYGDYMSARRNAGGLMDYVATERARASAEGQKYVMDSMAPFNREIAAFRQAGDRPSGGGLLGEAAIARRFVTGSAAKQLRKAYSELDDMERQSVRDVASKKSDWKRAIKAFDDLRPEVAELHRIWSDPEGALFPAGGTTAKRLRDYYEFRRAWRQGQAQQTLKGRFFAAEGPEGLGLPSNRGVWSSLPNIPGKPVWTESRHDQQGPFKRLAKIAWSYVYPPYRVEKPPERKLPEGRKPPLLDRWQERASKSTWGRYIPNALGWTGLALMGYNALNKLDRQKEQKEGVEARAKQERNELMAGFTNVVQTAAAVPQAAMYGREGLHAVVAGMAAARGIGDAGAADKLLARVPPEVLYSHGLQSFDRTPADVRAAMGLGGKSALDLSDEEMHEFARSHLSGLADQYLNSWTNPVPASAEGGL